MTADALHTVKATANHIHEHGGEFVLPVKENRRALFDALDALPWGQVPIAHTATDKGHGRITTRTIQVLPAPEDLPFPHVSQVFLIERYVTDLQGQPDLGRRRARRRQPGTRAGRPRRPGRIRPGAVVDRVSALDPRHLLPRGQIPGQNPIRAKDHGCSPQPRDRSTPHGRTHRRHRSHPMGRTLHGPALHHPRTHIMILERPWNAPRRAHSPPGAGAKLPLAERSAGIKAAARTSRPACVRQPTSSTRSIRPGCSVRSPVHPERP